MDRIDRNYYLKQLIEKRDNGRVKVVTGIRRCGKSVLLFDIFGDYLKADGVSDEQLNVTGSNSKMLSTDVMTEFKDRGDEIHVNPLTYKEFHAAYDGDKRRAWQEYVTYGGLPRVMALKTDREKSQYLQNLIKKTYLTDVIERNHIQKDISVLDDLLNIVAIADAIFSRHSPSLTRRRDCKKPIHCNVRAIHTERLSWCATRSCHGWTRTASTT